MNEKYPETGIIYMPMDYYYDWCSDYTICTPDYKTISPNTHQHFQLYKKMMELYNMNSSKFYFDIDDEENLWKQIWFHMKMKNQNYQLLKILD